MCKVNIVQIKKGPALELTPSLVMRFAKAQRVLQDLRTDTGIYMNNYAIATQLSHKVEGSHLVKVLTIIDDLIDDIVSECQKTP